MSHMHIQHALRPYDIQITDEVHIVAAQCKQFIDEPPTLDLLWLDASDWYMVWTAEGDAPVELK